MTNQASNEVTSEGTMAMISFGCYETVINYLETFVWSLRDEFRFYADGTQEQKLLNEIVKDADNAIDCIKELERAGDIIPVNGMRFARDNDTAVMWRDVMIGARNFILALPHCNITSKAAVQNLEFGHSKYLQYLRNSEEAYSMPEYGGPQHNNHGTAPAA